MDIVKSLNLNKTPRAVRDRSLIFAKNIKLSEDGAFITNEEGFSDVLADEFSTNKTISGNIVGVIPCVKELVIFTYDTTDLKSRIYRAKEDDDDRVLEVELVSGDDINKGWKYSGGSDFLTEVAGTYMYNGLGQLIVAIAEYSKNDSNIIKVPLKTINLDNADDLNLLDSLLPVSPTIPIINLKVTEANYSSQGGDYNASIVPIPIGTYIFFIRYKIADNVYSNWIPVGIPYTVTMPVSYNVIDHFTDVDFELGLEEGSDPNVTHVNIFVNRDDAYSDRGLILTFTETGLSTNIYNTIQVGYILQKEEGSVARIWKEIALSNTDSVVSTTVVFDALFTEEYDINKFLDNPINFYNVKNITNYKNRLYIADYIETNYNEDTNVSGINIQCTTKDVFVTTRSNDIDRTTRDIKIKIGTYTVKITLTAADLRDRCFRLMSFPEVVEALNKSIIWEPNYNDIRNISVTDHFGENPDNPKPDVTIDKVYIYWDDPQADPPQPITNLNKFHFGCLDDDYLIVELAKGTGNPSTINLGRSADGTTKCGTIRDTNFKCAHVELELKRGLVYVNISNPTSTRSLMPNTKYSFYIHRVRKDGSYTNGKYIGDLTTNPVNYSENCIKKLSVKFTGIPNTIFDDEYIGCFFSYEKPKTGFIYSAVCIDAKQKLFRALDVESSLVTFYGTKVRTDAQIGTTGTLNPITTNEYDIREIKILYPNVVWVTKNNLTSDEGSNIVSTIGISGGIYIDCAFGDELKEGLIISVYNESNIINDTSVVKTLIPLGGALYCNGAQTYEYSEDTTKSDFNYDGYVTTESTFRYIVPVVINEDAGGGAHVINKTLTSENTGDVLKGIGTKILDSHYLNEKRFERAQKIYTDKAVKIYDNSSLNYAESIYYVKYSRLNELAFVIKKEPEILVSSIFETSSGYPIGVNRTNRIVHPINYMDLLKYSSDYLDKQYKAYVSYNSTISNILRFTNTLRRSNIISDESSFNSWKKFEANEYKIVSSAKSKILNIIGVGSVFIVHTEHNILFANASDILKTDANARVQLESPDLFDVEFNELITSYHGIGGLCSRTAWTINEKGYWWFDKDSKTLFNYDNNKINNFGDEIKRLFYAYKVIDAVIATDSINDRIIICFTIKTAVGASFKNITLSFNYMSGTFISMHDYYFLNRYNTKTRLYLTGLDTSVLYGNDDELIGYYGSLCFKKLGEFNEETEEYDIATSPRLMTAYPTTGHLIRHNYFVYGNPGHVGLRWDWCNHAYIDIIINSNIEENKVFNALSWIVNKIESYNHMNDENDDYDTRLAEEELSNSSFEDRQHWCGDVMRIYSNLCDSKDLDIHIPDDEEINQHNNYKYPYFDRGSWNLNYFRNNLAKPLTSEELSSKANYWPTNLDKLKKANGEFTYEDNPEEHTTKTVYRPSDERSLIYGKYFVVRFVFNVNTPDNGSPANRDWIVNKFKLESVSVNIRKD